MFLLIPAKGGLISLVHAQCLGQPCPNIYEVTTLKGILSREILTYSCLYARFIFKTRKHLTAYSNLSDKEQLAYVNNEVVYGLKTKD